MKPILLRFVRSVLLVAICVSSLTPAVFAQDPPQYGTPFTGVPDPPDVNLYQVHTRIFSQAGNLQGVISRLDQIQALGINTIYLMPHYPVGTDPRSSGSPYCIKDFKAVGAEYGTLDDLRQLVDGAHQRGMAVILDFIVNQTSFDHPWITQHPDWYEYEGGQIKALFPDVAALDMSNINVRNAMIDAMRYWIFAANVDGFRFDFANRPDISFWTAAINNLRSIPGRKLLLFAEGDRVENFTAGFDMNFGDKWFWDALRPIAVNNASASLLQTITDEEYALANSTQQVVRYTVNHDIIGRGDFHPLWPYELFTNHNGVVANFLLCAYMRGVPFLMSGQEVDFVTYVPYPWYSPKIDWNANPGAAADFTKILNFRTASTAIRRGTMTNYSNANVAAFTKTSGAEKVIVIVNLRNSQQTFVIPSAMSGTYIDAFTSTSVTLATGSTRTLAPYEYLVVTNNGGCTPTEITPYVRVNGGAWVQTASAELTTGGSITFGPQPVSGGSWSWSGPNGYSSTSREITLNNVQQNQAGVYTATYINVSGCADTHDFTLTVNAPPSNLPAPWSTADIGAVGAAGSASYADNTFSIIASGSDVFDYADEFRFVYQPFSGDVTVTARIVSLTNTHAWAKAGVMIRESLTGNSTNAAMLLTPSNGFNFQYRNGTGAGSVAAGNASGAIPNWVRITRSGNTITGYRSTNGINWTQVGSVTLNLPSTVYIGIFATSHNDGVLTTATFTNVSVVSGFNNPPTANAGPDQTLAAGTTSTILSGTGSDPDGSAVSYSWAKISGPSVTIINGNTATPTINGLSNGNSYVFRLTVSDGALTATDDVQVTVNSTGNYLAIRNRWQNTYLYDAGTNTGYGSTIADDNYLWEMEATEGAYFRLKNVGTGHYMHIENQTGTVQCTSIDPSWWSAQWSLDNVDATYVRIRNRWQTGNMIHIENLTGFAQYSNAQTGWYSAHWEFVNTGGSGARMVFERPSIVYPGYEGASLVEVYPNPVTGESFTIDVPAPVEGGTVNIAVQDLNGRELMTLNNAKPGIVQHDLPTGLYFLTIASNEWRVVKKIMIKR